MEKVDCIIIGAGVVGLAIAARLGRKFGSTVVIERHDSFGRESSSRNSEVIHAGLYYAAESLRTKLCIKGNRLLYEFCSNRGISHRPVGKIIISTSTAEEESIAKLYAQAIRNGVGQLQWLSQDELRALEPEVKAGTAFYSGTTGIIDSHAYMKQLENEAIQDGVIFAYNCTAKQIIKEDRGYTVVVSESNGELSELGTRFVINAAGIGAPDIASMAGIEIEGAGYCIRPCKGEYFRVSNRHRGKINHLIYPAPTEISLGIHTVIDMAGALKLGPSASFVDSIDYNVDETHAAEFFESASAFLPFLELSDLSPDMAGIRAKLAGIGFNDFIIRDEHTRGLPGFINLIGIESPGLTSSLAIADYVDDIIKKESIYD